MAAVIVAALPRAGWFALTAFMATSLVAHAHAGGALLLLAGALVPVVLAPRDATAWPLSAGRAGARRDRSRLRLAGVAGLTGPIWRRATLGATGWVWLALARATYTSSTSDALHHVLAPLLTAGTLVGAGRLGGGRDRASVGRDPALAGARGDAVGGLGAGARAGDGRGLARGDRTPANFGRNAVLGAFAGALVALVTRRAGHRLASARWAKDCAPTA